MAAPHMIQTPKLEPGNLVERFFNKIRQCRRVATRYDKLAANYLAFIQLASKRYGRARFTSSRPKLWRVFAQTFSPTE
jgi:hypothetical protein